MQPVTIIGIRTLLLTMGVARFSYTPLLPLMQSQAGLGVAEAGWLAAINYLGYLSGAIVAALTSSFVIKDRLYRGGLMLAVAATAAMGMTTSVAGWALARYLSGLATAAGMLAGTGLILNWLIRHNYRSELGIHFSGLGLGIAGSALAVQWMSGRLDWHEQWLAFSGIGLFLLIPALLWLPQPDTNGPQKAGAAMADNPPSPLFLRFFMAYYFCAGVGYVVTATFIVAIANQLPGLNGKGTWIFLAIGLGAAPACIAWDLVARRTGDLNALLLATILEVVGIVLPVEAHGMAAALAGSVVFGSAMMGTVSLVLTMAGRYYPSRPATMMGKMTIAYGFAQIVAPAITGWLAVRVGGYTTGLYGAAAVMGLGVVILVMLKTIEKREAAPASARSSPTNALSLDSPK